MHGVAWIRKFLLCLKDLSPLLFLRSLLCTCALQSFRIGPNVRGVFSSSEQVDERKGSPKIEDPLDDGLVTTRTEMTEASSLLHCCLMSGGGNLSKRKNVSDDALTPVSVCNLPTFVWFASPLCVPGQYCFRQLLDLSAPLHWLAV